MPLKYPFSHTRTAWEARHGETGHNKMETISMIKKILIQLLYTCIYADFMHFVIFVKLYPVCPSMNRHFRNMHSHSVDVCSRFSLTSQGSFLEYFERQSMTVELSGSVVLFHNRRYFSRMYMWRHIQYLNMLVLKIKFDLSCDRAPTPYTSTSFICRGSSSTGTVVSAFLVLTATTDPLYHERGFDKQH